MTQQTEQGRQSHPDDDEHTEGITYGLWLLKSPFRHGRDGEPQDVWNRLREETGAPVWMARARFVQSSSRALAAHAASAAT